MIEPVSMRKKKFRARGSRGGTRRKKHAKSPANHYDSYAHGHAPSKSYSQSQPQNYEHIHLQHRHGYSQADLNQASYNNNAHHQHVVSNTFASMAYTSSTENANVNQVQRSRFPGSNSALLKVLGTSYNDENTDPNRKPMIHKHDSSIFAAKRNFITLKANDKQHENDIASNLPMQTTLTNHVGKYILENASTLAPPKLSTSIQIPDANLNHRDEPINYNQNQYSIFGGLDLLSTIQPMFDAEKSQKSHGRARGIRNDHCSFANAYTNTNSTTSAMEEEQSYFETSPRSFLMGKNNSRNCRW